jgi:hypothetical protein
MHRKRFGCIMLPRMMGVGGGVGLSVTSGIFEGNIATASLMKVC